MRKSVGGGKGLIAGVGGSMQIEEGEVGRKSNLVLTKFRSPNGRKNLVNRTSRHSNRGNHGAAGDIIPTAGVGGVGEAEGDEAAVWGAGGADV